MRPLFLAAVFGVLAGAAPASAQVLSIEFHDGQVRLIAENVPVGRILSEWTRVGGTRIVNGERIPGGPVSLQLVDVPESEAIAIVLRGAAGYMVAARQDTAPGASTLDRIMVLPTSSRAPSTTPAPPPPPPPAQFIEQPTDDEIIDPESEPEPEQPGPPGLPPAFRRRVQPGGNNPGTVQQPPPPDQPEDVPPDEANPFQQPEPTPGNPFGVPPGNTQPGSIAPVPRAPNTRQPR